MSICVLGDSVGVLMLPVCFMFPLAFAHPQCRVHIVAIDTLIVLRVHHTNVPWQWVHKVVNSSTSLGILVVSVENFCSLYWVSYVANNDNNDNRDVEDKRNKSNCDYAKQTQDDRRYFLGSRLVVSTPISAVLVLAKISSHDESYACSWLNPDIRRKRKSQNLLI